MKLTVIPYPLTVCKVVKLTPSILNGSFYFIGKTDEELSLVCVTDETPEDTTAREDGWCGFRIEGILDFSLIGILAPIADILAENKIGIFAVSTYNTDYVLVKKENFGRALEVLTEKGYDVEKFTDTRCIRQ